MRLATALFSIVMCLFLTFTMMPAQAFATDEHQTVTVQSDSAASPQSRMVEGNITTDQGNGANVIATNDGKADLTVTGSVQAEIVGVHVVANGNSSKATVNVGGSVSSEESSGISADSERAGETTVTVGAGVTGYTSGVSALSNYNDSKTKVDVTGNVTSTGEASTSIIALAYQGGTTDVSIKGNVEDKASQTIAGLAVVSDDGSSKVNAVVLGNVASAGTGLAVESVSGGQIDVLIDGTLKGDKAGINFKDINNIDKVDVTVWKIEKGENGNLFTVGGQTPGDNDLAKIRQNVHYIVKLEQPTEGATLSATKADGTAFDKMHDLGTAIHGERVFLKVDLKPRYKLDGVYYDDGKKAAMLQDENGNYYVDVTDGGGIYLSVAVSKTQHNISYNLDGGSYNGQIGTITQVYDYGTAIKLLGTPTRKGYKFLYWRGSQYDAGADYTVEGDHLFTAVWEKVAPQQTDDTGTTPVKKTVTKAASASPATGDESELAPWISILTVAALALVYVVRRRVFSK